VSWRWRQWSKDRLLQLSVVGNTKFNWQTKGMDWNNLRRVKRAWACLTKS